MLAVADDAQIIEIQCAGLAAFKRARDIASEISGPKAMRKGIVREHRVVVRESMQGWKPGFDVTGSRIYFAILKRQVLHQRKTET